MMDSDFYIDMEEVKNLIKTSDVLLVRFATVDKRLLIDNRSNETTGPYITLVNRASSVEQRFRELKELRPQFALPDHIMSFHWPKMVSSMKELGIVELIAERFRQMGHEDAVPQCYEAFARLEGLEKREAISAIRGEGYQSIWERK